MKHIWTLWGAVSGQLKRALAELHRRGGRRCEPPPVRAGPQFESGLGCEPVGATRVGFPGRVVALCCWGGAGTASVVLVGWAD